MKTVLAHQTEHFKMACLLSDDRLKLFLNLEPLFKSDTEQVSDFADQLEQTICTALEKIIKAELIDIEVLKDVIKTILTGAKVTERRIAKGLAPSEARDGKLLFMVKKLTCDAEVSLDEKGRANFKELHFFDNIEKGQTVARVYPPAAGAVGCDALGQTIPAILGKEAVFQLSDSLLLQAAITGQTYSTIVANLAGYLLQDNDNFSISNELRINSDVDYTTGNINFVGKVFIKGNVKLGFAVKARSGIELNGALEAGSLEVTAGSVSVTGLAYGTEKTYVKASEDVSLVLAQDLTVNAGRNINIKKEARNSKLLARTSINMPTATLLGGVAHVVCGLEALNIGNDTNLNTNIIISSDLEMGADYHQTVAAIANHEKAIELVRLHLGPLAKNPKRVSFLKLELRNKMEKLIEKLDQLTKSHAKLCCEREQISSTGKRSTIVRINYQKDLFPGVLINAKDQEFKITEPLKGPATIEYDHSKNVLESVEYRPMICEFKENKEKISDGK